MTEIKPFDLEAPESYVNRMISLKKQKQKKNNPDIHISVMCPDVTPLLFTAYNWVMFL